ncbi:hypothetical protein [Pseudomonas phage vB_Pae-PA152]|nr:hypothetical protein [Pseudomonas phage vB_Pae-PA152]
MLEERTNKVGVLIVLACQWLTTNFCTFTDCSQFTSFDLGNRFRLDRLSFLGNNLFGYLSGRLCYRGHLFSYRSNFLFLGDGLLLSNLYSVGQGSGVDQCLQGFSSASQGGSFHGYSITQLLRTGEYTQTLGRLNLTGSHAFRSNFPYTSFLVRDDVDEVLSTLHLVEGIADCSELGQAGICEGTQLVYLSSSSFDVPVGQGHTHSIAVLRDTLETITTDFDIGTNTGQTLQFIHGFLGLSEAAECSAVFRGQAIGLVRNHGSNLLVAQAVRVGHGQGDHTLSSFRRSRCLGNQFFYLGSSRRSIGMQTLDRFTSSLQTLVQILEFCIILSTQFGSVGSSLFFQVTDRLDLSFQLSTLFRGGLFQLSFTLFPCSNQTSNTFFTGQSLDTFDIRDLLSQFLFDGVSLGNDRFTHFGSVVLQDLLMQHTHRTSRVVVLRLDVGQVSNVTSLTGSGYSFPVSDGLFSLGLGTGCTTYSTASDVQGTTDSCTDGCTFYDLFDARIVQSNLGFTVGLIAFGYTFTGTGGKSRAEQTSLTTDTPQHAQVTDLFSHCQGSSEGAHLQAIFLIR